MADAADFEPAHENTTPLFSMGHLGMSPGALSAKIRRKRILFKPCRSADTGLSPKYDKLTR